MKMRMLGPSPEQVLKFQEDGFLVVEDFLDRDLAEAAAARFEALFRGEFEAGLQPDEWNWREGRDDPSLTRQICNAWKADRVIGRAVLAEKVGHWVTELMDWPGARINQANVIWKPPGAKALGFHQDDSYQDWIVPQEMSTCWMALDDTSAAGGTIEYVRGSHLWDLYGKIAQFHAPEDEVRSAESGRHGRRDRYRRGAHRGGARRCGLPPRPYLARLRPQPGQGAAPFRGFALHA